jgi:hypothetical protein
VSVICSLGLETWSAGAKDSQSAQPSQSSYLGLPPAPLLLISVSQIQSRESETRSALSSFRSLGDTGRASVVFRVLFRAV